MSLSSTSSKNYTQLSLADQLKERVERLRQQRAIAMPRQVILAANLPPLTPVVLKADPPLAVLSKRPRDEEKEDLVEQEFALNMNNDVVLAQKSVRKRPFELFLADWKEKNPGICGKEARQLASAEYRVLKPSKKKRYTQAARLIQMNEQADIALKFIMGE
jgi:hypothetical protein